MSASALPRSQRAAMVALRFTGRLLHQAVSHLGVRGDVDCRPGHRYGSIDDGPVGRLGDAALGELRLMVRRRQRIDADHGVDGRLFAQSKEATLHHGGFKK